MPLSRRTLLQLAAACASVGNAEVAFAGAPRGPIAGPFEERVLRVEGAPDLARAAKLLWPRGAAGPLPVLVLFHGLGETKREADGLIAWSERYGVQAAASALLAPPLLPGRGRHALFGAKRATVLNGWLTTRSFRPYAVLCPFTPDVFRRPLAPSLDRYADWVFDRLLPEARAVAPLVEERSRALSIDGCSLGGYVALELLRRRSPLLGSAGALQPALDEGGAPEHAEHIAHALARSGPLPLRLATSTGDGYRKAVEATSRSLRRLAIPHELAVSPGGHDQRFLREVGTLELLLWHERQLWARFDVEAAERPRPAVRGASNG